MNDFNNRMDAQREFLKAINVVEWRAEPLVALSRGAIDRWISVNQLPAKDAIVLLVEEAGDALYFLANKSQEQVSSEYQDASEGFGRLIDLVRDELHDRGAR